eukprot:CAMPEP_0206544664 /NCGR_PEP_ID=MMETSP0325_2-20121206/11672_1 /ASSEMBLY_ACC=CAM_ASM_000347 /TAXON_ID=2866 /ORGANISM="Crypthecodinium cohnii, Strain Seligo" /LENGTH=633 /DNA_ID=CAMNT_0054043495 /DNA_START=226 /DNA_END=2123 /DNA_ORIENTATION=-
MPIRAPTERKSAHRALRAARGGQKERKSRGGAFDDSANLRRAVAVAGLLIFLSIFGLALVRMHEVAVASADEDRPLHRFSGPDIRVMSQVMEEAPLTAAVKASPRPPPASPPPSPDAAAKVQKLRKPASSAAAGSLVGSDSPKHAAELVDQAIDKTPASSKSLRGSSKGGSGKAGANMTRLQERRSATSTFISLHKGDVLPVGTDLVTLVVIAHDKADCLKKCLTSLAESRDEDKKAFKFAVSLDHPPAFSNLEAVAESFKSSLPGLEVWKKTEQSHMNAAVVKISEHFRFALTETFERRENEFAIFLETDLVVAPDFLWYFRASAWLLRMDPTLYCISAWNDNGNKDLVFNDKRIFRTDYFPGLGWMIERKTWFELKPQWPAFPSTGWDHWLRHGGILEDRGCISPEVPRTHHFDEHGTNVKKKSSLAKTLANMALSKLQPESLGDLSYLMQEEYESALQEKAKAATLIQVADIPQTQAATTYLVPYSREEYTKMAKSLKIVPGQPRTHYHGVVETRHPTTLAWLILADRRMSGFILPPSEVWRPSLQRLVGPARPNESCEDFCTRSGQRCVAKELAFINQCNFLRTHFSCEAGCGQNLGADLPCYVTSSKRDTSRQCLTTDAAPTCSGKHP